MSRWFSVQILVSLMVLVVAGCSPSFTDEECDSAADCFPNEVCSPAGVCIPGGGTTDMAEDGDMTIDPDMGEDMATLPVDVVDVLPATATLDLLQTILLAATPKDENGDTVDATVTWASSDDTLATVDSAGLVTALAEGSVTITASADGVDGLATIEVTKNAVDSVTVNPASTDLGIGATLALTFTALDATGNELLGRTATWTSSDEGVATVDAAGVVTGVALGSTTLTVDVEGVTGTSAITVVPDAVASVTVTPATASIEAFVTVQLTGQALDAQGGVLLGRTITWTSSDDLVATVDSTGLVSGVAAGAATITATSEQQTATAAITVTPSLVASIVLTPDTAQMAPSDTLQLSAATLDSGGADLGRSVTWITSDANVLTVDSSGLVTAIGTGSAAIQARIGSMFDTAAITVEVPIDSVDVQPSAVSVVPGGTTTLTATPRDAQNNTLTGRGTPTWMSSDAGVATISSAGLVTGVAAGTATMTATIDGVQGSAVVTVQVPVNSVEVLPSAATLLPGNTASFTATPKDAGGMTLSGRPAATWMSQDASVATVDSNGLVTAVASGVTVIFATIEGVVGSAAVEVLVPIDSVVVTGSAAGADIGQTVTFTADPRDDMNTPLTGRTCTFASSNPAVATVDSTTGVATIQAVGDTTITAGCEGVDGSAPIAGYGAVTSVSVTPVDPTISVSATQAFSAELRDSANHILTGRTVVWTSSAATTIVTIDANTGVATGVAAGSSTITATSEGQTGTSLLTVN